MISGGGESLGLIDGVHSPLDMLDSSSLLRRCISSF